MASKRKIINEVVVGASILVALVIAAWGYIYLRELPVKRNGYTAYIHFNDITGLETGDPVSVSGLKIGRVQEMKLKPGFVQVRVWLNGDIALPKDSRAAIKAIGMIGEKYIDVKPGHAEAQLSQGDTLRGDYVDDIADMGEPVSELIQRTNTLLAKLNTAMDNAFGVHTQKDFSKILENTRQVSEQLRRDLGDNLLHMQTILTNIDTLSAGMKAYWQANGDAVGQTTSNIAAASENLGAITAKLDSVLTVTRTLLADVENQRGAVGKALRSDELYLKADSTLSQMQALLDDMKANPAKYLRISVIDLF